VKSLAKVEWVLKRVSKFYLKNQWLECLKIKRFNKAKILQAIMYKSEHSWWRDNNYTKKLVIEKLSQTIYNFPNI